MKWYAESLWTILWTFYGGFALLGIYHAHMGDYARSTNCWAMIGAITAFSHLVAYLKRTK